MTFSAPLSYIFVTYYRVAELQSSIDATTGAFDVIAKAKSHLDETTTSMQWEVFGWPQKVRKNLGLHPSTAQIQQITSFMALRSSNAKGVLPCKQSSSADKLVGGRSTSHEISVEIH